MNIKKIYKKLDEFFFTHIPQKRFYPQIWKDYEQEIVERYLHEVELLTGTKIKVYKKKVSNDAVLIKEIT